MAQQHWSRWYTEERVSKMDIKQLSKEHKAITNTLAAFEENNGQGEYDEQIKECKAVLYVVEEAIKNLLRKIKKGGQK